MRKWIERQKNIFDFTLSSLVRRKKKNAALILVYTLMVFFLASVLFFTHALREEASLILKEAPEMIVQRLTAGRHELIPVAYADTIRAINGVISVTERLWGYYYDPTADANYTLMAVEDPDLVSGSIAIGEGISRIRGVNEGDRMDFLTYQGKLLELKIKKTFSAESGLISSDLILISAPDFRSLFGTPADYAVDLNVRIRNPKELSTIARKVAYYLPDTRQILKQEILRTYDALFNWRGGIMLAVFSGAMLAFFIFAWDKASGLSEEERKEIGILKGIGWEIADIVRMKSFEGLSVSITSFLTGLLCAYIHVFFSSSILFEPVLKGWAVLYPKFKLTPFIDLTEIASLFFFTVAPYTVATIIPSWRAATADPDSVMRQ